MASERLNIDVFANLKGDFKFLKDLQSSGIKGKVELSILSSKGDFQKLEKLRTQGLKINAELNLLKKGGMSQIEKLQKSGFSIKTELKLTGEGFKKLEQLQTKGIVIPMKFSGGDIEKLTGGRRPSGGGGGTSFIPKGGGKLDLTAIRGFSNSGVAIIGPGGKSFAVPFSKTFQQNFEKTILEGVKKQSLGKTIESFTAARGLRGDVRTQRTLKSGNIGELFESALVRSIAGKRVVTSASASRTGDISEAELAGIRKSLAPRLVKSATAPGGSGVLTTARSDALINEFEAIAAEQTRSRRRVLDQLLREDAIRNSRSGIIRQRRSDRRLNEAQRDVNLLPFFSNKEAGRDRIADRFGLLPSDLSIPPAPTGIRRVVGRGGFIDPRRIKNTPGALREIGFAGLFGGAPGAIGATLGGAITPGGAFLGGTIAQVAVDRFNRTFEKVKEVLLEVSEAGLQFEESIVGISSVLQATTRISGPGGASVSLPEQLRFQTQRARDIQTQARKGLLPLGIGGRSESALVSAIVTGFAQQGVSLSPDEVATLSRRIGGAIQAQRPDLLNNTNRLRLEVEDAISNPSRITALTPVLRSFAPNLAKATTGAEALRFSTGLEAFPQALTQNTDSSVIALRKFNAEIENIKVSFGSEFLQALTPAFNSLAEVLGDKDFQESITNVARGLGTLANAAIQAAAFFAKIGINITKSDSSTGSLGAGASAASGGTIGGGIGLLGGAAAGAVAGGFTIASLATIPIGALIGALAGGTQGALLGGSFGNPLARIGKREREKAEQEAQKRRKNLKSAPSTSEQIELFKKTGTEEGSLRAFGLINQLSEETGKDRLKAIEDSLKKGTITQAEADKAKSLLPGEIQSIRGFQIDEISQSLLSAIAGRRASKASTFDTFLGAGQFGQNISNLGFDTKVIAVQTQLVKIREEELEKAKELVKTSENKAVAEANVLTAQRKLNEALDQAKASTVQAAESFRKFYGILDTRLSNLLSTVNTNTLAGQGQSLAFRQQKLDAENLLISQQERLGLAAPGEINLRKGQNRVAQEQLTLDQQLRPGQVREAFGQATKALLDFSNLQTTLNQSLQGMKDAVFRATTALEDFDAEGDLRKALDAQKRVQAATAAREAGVLNATFGLQTATESFAADGDKGSLDEINRRVARERLKQALRQTDPTRRKREDLAERNGLVSNLFQANTNLKQEPLTRGLSQIDLLQRLISIRSTVPKGSQLEQSLNNSINSLGKDNEDLFGKFPQFKDFVSKLEQQSKVREGSFSDLTDVSSKVGTIDSNVQKIVALLGGSPNKSPATKSSEDNSGDLGIIPKNGFPNEFKSIFPNGIGSGPTPGFGPPTQETFGMGRANLSGRGFSDDQIRRLNEINEKLRTSTSSQEVSQLKKEYISILKTNPGLEAKEGDIGGLTSKLFQPLPGYQEATADANVKIPSGLSSGLFNTGLIADSTGPQQMAKRVQNMSIPEFNKFLSTVTDTNLRESYLRLRYPPGTNSPNYLDKVIESSGSTIDILGNSLRENTGILGRTLFGPSPPGLLIKEGITRFLGGDKTKTGAEILPKDSLMGVTSSQTDTPAFAQTPEFRKNLLDKSAAYFGGTATGTPAELAARGELASGLFDAVTARDRSQNIIRSFPNKSLSTNINSFRSATGSLGGLPAISPIEGGISGNFGKLKDTLGRLASSPTAALNNISSSVSGGAKNTELENALKSVVDALKNPQGFGNEMSKALRSSFGGAP